MSRFFMVHCVVRYIGKSREQSFDCHWKISGT